MQERESSEKNATLHSSPAARPTHLPYSMHSVPLTSPMNQIFEPEIPARLLPQSFASPFGRSEDSVSEAGGSRMTAEKHPRNSQVTGIDVDGSGVGSFSAPKKVKSPMTSTGGLTNNLFVLVQWLDLYFVHRPGWKPIFPLFRQGISYTSELTPSTPFLSMPGLAARVALLPPLPILSRYFDIFFHRYYPLFPILCRRELESFVSESPESYANLDIGIFAIIQAVCSLAADEESGAVSLEGTRFLEAAMCVQTRLTGHPSLSSIQALLLMALALRNRNKDITSWVVLGQAIRLAHAINLHRSDYDDSGPNDMASRVWWTAHIMERTLELETARPSAIHDSECDQREPTSVAAPGMFDYFKALIDLARLQTRVIRLLYHSGSRHRVDGVTAGSSVKDLLFEMGHIDRALLDWADTFPESIRPGRDIFCGNEELPLATYVTVQFHQTMIALHRPALMSAPGFLRNRINIYCAGTPLRDRLHFSLCIGASSARAILKAVNDLRLYAPVTGQLSRLLTSDQVLLAVLVLGIYATKVPMSRLNRADLALVETFGEQVEQDYRLAGHNENLILGIKLFRTQLHEYIAGSSAESIPATAMNGAASSQLGTYKIPAPAPTPAMAEPTNNGGLDLTVEAADLEASWVHFWKDDFEKLLSMPTDAYGVDIASTTNMYLMGIPQSWP